MSNGTTAILDRRIEVIEGANDDQDAIQRVSDLRPYPFVVLLGEPGIGKTTVLECEAAKEGVPVLKVRALITGARTSPRGTLFLDALDEYRADGQPRDKVDSLASAIIATQAARWRLSCRSEDWRKGSDMESIRKTTAGTPIVVAHLLPLDRSEAMTVLTVLGEGDPETFLGKAESLGATGFIENPLSLRLLHTAVADGGVWPSTRYDLFAAAVRRLAFEYNDDYKRQDDRHEPNEILDAAAQACLHLLISGARAIWRSAGVPPGGADARAYIAGNDLGVDRALVNDMLDTPLFRGEGETFEPMHRTVAEYLAGKALARAVAGSATRAALPLSRAVAMITDAAGLPPTELRGLYAWFAVHLAKLGETAAALRLIEADAVTVLVYGDAASFDTPARRAMLANLDRNDPYFRASEAGGAAVGGLAGEDLANEFTAVLVGPPDGSHRLLTVFDALTGGPPVLSMRPLLRDIMLDASRSGWQRRRALDAYLNGADDAGSTCRQLFDALALEPVSIAREELRAQLAARLPPAALTPADLISILSDYQKCPDDRTTGRLYRLQRRLEGEPLPALFDEPLKNALPKNANRSLGIEVWHVLDFALAGAIDGTKDLSATRLWQWTVNVRDYPSSKLPDRTANAIATWLDNGVGREAALFEAALAHSDPTKGPWAVIQYYAVIARRYPSAVVTRHLLAKAQSMQEVRERMRLFEIIVELARHPAADVNTYWVVYDVVAQERDHDTILHRLLVEDIDSWRIEERTEKESARRREAEDRAANVHAMAPWLGDMRIGGQRNYLRWAARLYFETGDDDEPNAGVKRVVHRTDDATVEAILAGWQYLATNGLGGIGATQLGKAEAEGQIYTAETAVMAGVDRLLCEDRLPPDSAIPIEVAIACLKSSWDVAGQQRRARLEHWALGRLNLDAAAGAAQLVDFWCATLDAGSTRITSLWRLLDDDAHGGAVEQALDTLLATRPSMPRDALHAAVRVGAKHLDRARLLKLAEAALGDATVTDEQRATWSLVAFALDPARHAKRFVTEHDASDAAALLGGDLGTAIYAALADFDPTARLHLNAMIVRLVGRKVAPQDDYPRGTINAAINAIASDVRPEAAGMLSPLINDPNLMAWRPHLRHAQAQQAALHRDRGFTHPMPAVVRAAIAGGPPVNARDLRAVVMEELGQLRSELRTTDTTPWKNYWNLKGDKVDTPLVENQCRDRLLDRLRDRLKKYGIAAAVPEARRGEETRTDMLIFSGAGRNLPIEVKRHFHQDIWIAASTQLQDYTADPGADGFGIYLVFWFGNGEGPTPARSDGSVGPMSAAELEPMLAGDLSPEVRTRTDVIVFDVSSPHTAGLRKPRRRRPPQGKR